MKKSKREALVLVLYAFVGSLAGGIIAKILSYIPYLEFLDKYGKANIFSVNFNPLFDIFVLRFGFSFGLGVNLGSIIGIIMAIVIWTRRR